MKAFHHPTRAGYFLITDDDNQLKAAAVFSPDTEVGADRLYFDGGISLMLLTKLAKVWFPEGRVFADEHTILHWGTDPRLVDKNEDLVKTASGYGVMPSFSESFRFMPSESEPMPIDMSSLTALEKDAEMELWKRYKNKGDMRAMNELIRAYKPMMKHRTKAWTTNSPLPKTAVEGEANRLIRKAIDTYDPKKGAALNTHVWNYLHKVHRYGYTFQNVGSIPEPRAAKVGKYQNSYSQLEDKYGREPTTDELQKDLGWKASDINAIQKELRSDLDLSGELTPVMASNADPAIEALFAVYHDSDPERKEVMEYTFDEFTNRPTGKNAADIAKRVGISPDKVRRHHKVIAKSARSILDETVSPMTRVSTLAFPSFW